MSNAVAREVKRQIQERLNGDKKRFDEAQEAALAEADAIAQKAAEDAVAVATQQAADEQLRIDAMNAERLARYIDGYALPTVTEREEYMRVTGITVQAMGRAMASGPAAPYMKLENPSREWYSAGVDEPPHARFYGALNGLEQLALLKLGDAGREAVRLREEVRKSALDALADAAVEEWAKTKKIQDRLEGN